MSRDVVYDDGMASDPTEPRAEQAEAEASRPAAGSTADIQWVNTGEAAKRLGITTRTLYRFIDEGQLPAYRFGRVIRLKEDDIASFIDDCRIEPGTLEHLYPESTPAKD